MSSRTSRAAAGARSRRPRRRPAPVVEVSPFPLRGHAAAVSFRCAPELFEALVRAAAERKPLRRQPYTQQDILCVALTEWLVANGHWPPTA